MLILHDYQTMEPVQEQSLYGFVLILITLDYGDLCVCVCVSPQPPFVVVVA